MVDPTVIEEEGTVIESGEPPLEANPEIVARARTMGWRPFEEYNGDKSRWVDAETFVRRGETELPIVRERYRKLESRFVNVEKELEESNKRNGEVVRVLNEVRELSKSAEERAYARAMSELAERERKAVSEAAVADYDRIQHEKHQLNESRPKLTSTPPPPPPVEPPKPVTSPVIDAWVAENPWFNSDPVLNSIAIAFDAQIQREAPGIGMAERLAEVKKQVMTRFPDKFGNPRRTAPPTVTTTHLAAPRSTKKGIKDLPPEAQAAFARFKKQMPNYTEDEYLQAYGAME